MIDYEKLEVKYHPNKAVSLFYDDIIIKIATYDSVELNQLHAERLLEKTLRNR